MHNPGDNGRSCQQKRQDGRKANVKENDGERNKKEKVCPPFPVRNHIGDEIPLGDYDKADKTLSLLNFFRPDDSKLIKSLIIIKAGI